MIDLEGCISFEGLLRGEIAALDILVEIILMFINPHDLFDDEKNNTIQQFIDNMPIIIAANDLNSQFLIGNNLFAKAAGLPSGQTLKGRYANEFNFRAKEIAPLCIAEDMLVIKRKQVITVLCYGFYANNQPLLTYGKKYPIIDKKGAVLGAGFCLQDVTTSQLINLAPLLSLRKTAYGNRQLGDQFSYIITESIPEYDLSNRQIECLFHLLRGQSAKDIAITLNIGKRTVETHIDAIKCKLGCDTKAQLIDKALSAGLLNYIPSGLIQKLL